MDNRIDKYFKINGIKRDIEFTALLNEFILQYQKKHQISKNEILKTLGISKQRLFYWSLNQENLYRSVKKIHFVTNRAINLFQINNSIGEKIANSAGLSIVHLKSDKQDDNSFIIKFNELLSEWKGSYKNLYELANVSEQMFYKYKIGKNINKYSLTALLIVLEISKEDIQLTLNLKGLF